MMLMSHPTSPGKGHLLPDEEERAHLTCLHRFTLGVSVAVVSPLNKKDDLFLFSVSQTGILK